MASSAAMVSRSGFLPVFRALLPALILFVAIVGARAETSLERLEIVTSTGTHEFRVEVADKPSERAKGLMYRKSMPEDQGMLFDFHVEGPVMMWMKNTYLPLDMIFVSRQGVVTKVAANTVPMSEEVISSGGPAYAVIELNAGAADKIGIKAGDQIRHPAFRR
ncbi:DUF192 domain-containing protein [Methylocystis sp. MJC1]|uniref:DUF192 domain-containing protein n=1 Tax=Methylocystis sp. MJC1 TaxID=2654282 RepID=UPI001FF022E1|nr:DUF192 domain-containing protein [Methylocystis sp. MJC1]KAF2992158.1 hypothetical protein MJC1_00533 [Methylocystis sp. MJC1]UZX10252.1 DUF192 domain-containing protein [Methylocystis sp. MJC1]